MKTSIQITDSYSNKQDAQQALAFQSIQEGYLGGRVLPPNDVKPLWRMQVFNDPCNVQFNDWLPDGMRLVVIPLH
jgi:hypothetical protein